MKTINIKNSKPLRTAWVFYILIVFEIVYMISPFGVLYYSVYGKGLNFLNNFAFTRWLTQFFLPHLTESKLFIFNVYKDLGWLLAYLGFVLFFINAVYLYFYKLIKKKPATGGIYSYIRHPQYLFLLICSFGLLLAWPRYLVLIVFVLMLYAYYFLAKHEEKECTEKYGIVYSDYLKKTNMFFPFKIIKFRFPLLLTIKKQYLIFLKWFLILFSFMVVIYGAELLKSVSIDYLYSSYSTNSAFISLTKIDKITFSKVISIAESDTLTRIFLAKYNIKGKVKYINYIMPSEWYFADLPMNIPSQANDGHYTPVNYNKTTYKILFTKVTLSENADGKDIILKTLGRIPILEIEIDLQKQKVTQIKKTPNSTMWGNIPTPIF